MTNRAKAQKIYNETDPDRGFLDMLKREIRDNEGCDEKYVLNNLLTNYIHEDVNNVISLLEAIGEYCNSDTTFSEYTNLVGSLATEYECSDLSSLFTEIYR